MIELAADKAGWGKTLPQGEGLGIAGHRSFVSYIATVVHAKVGADGTVRVPEVHVAIDCGFVANPERVLLAGAGRLRVRHDGRALQRHHLRERRGVESNFNDYAMMRADNFPETVHVHIVRASVLGARDRRRRAGRAALLAGADQRDLQRHRQAHPQSAGGDQLA